jgi:hypothetical protein
MGMFVPDNDSQEAWERAEKAYSEAIKVQAQAYEEIKHTYGIV